MTVKTITNTLLFLQLIVLGTCTCGSFGFRVDEDEWTRIVGGTVAEANSIPYQVKLAVAKGINIYFLEFQNSGICMTKKTN